MTQETQHTTGKVIAAQGNLVTIRFDGDVRQNEVVYVNTGGKKLKSEVIEIEGDTAKVQVYEPTEGIRLGDTVAFDTDLLSVELGPGLLKNVFDGLQNPLNDLAEEAGYFLPRGLYLSPLDREKKWEFTPVVSEDDTVQKASYLGEVPEAVIKHKIMMPFTFQGRGTVKKIAPAGEYTIDDVIAEVADENGTVRKITMTQRWPVKFPISFGERQFPTEQLVTKQRTIDGPFPVAKGGTFCTPGPFGSGKTVLQHQISKYAQPQVVIVVACGERAGEVVEILREFPELDDPSTGKKLIDRTSIICNTSSMPVAARESSVYMGVTIAEYYRQMGIDTLMLADSTSRWAQALREMSGRLEEIPGEEAFPAYLSTRIAELYERAGVLKNPDDETGSVTIGGTVSPAGGNFEEPVTLATLSVVGCFLGLSSERAHARRYPAIDPLISWSKYNERFYEHGDETIRGRVSRIRKAQSLIRESTEIGKKMSVVGEEGISVDDMTTFLKGEFYDAVFLQQNAFDPVDTATDIERQYEQLELVHTVLQKEFTFEDHDTARDFFKNLTDKVTQLNYTAADDSGYEETRKTLLNIIEEQ